MTGFDYKSDIYKINSGSVLVTQIWKYTYVNIL